jgi:hypothetical protein
MSQSLTPCCTVISTVSHSCQTAINMSGAIMLFTGLLPPYHMSQGMSQGCCHHVTGLLPPCHRGCCHHVTGAVATMSQGCCHHVTGPLPHHITELLPRHRAVATMTQGCHRADHITGGSIVRHDIAHICKHTSVPVDVWNLQTLQKICGLSLCYMAGPGKLFY